MHLDTHTGCFEDWRWTYGFPSPPFNLLIHSRCYTYIEAFFYEKDDICTVCICKVCYAHCALFLMYLFMRKQVLLPPMRHWDVLIIVYFHRVPAESVKKKILCIFSRASLHWPWVQKLGRQQERVLCIDYKLIRRKEWKSLFSACRFCSWVSPLKVGGGQYHTLHRKMHVKCAVNYWCCLV